MNSKRNKNNTATAKVADIEDFVIEILLRVPAKPLLKLKCVSKQWLSLISDQQFCRSHARLHQILNPNRPTYLLLDNYDNYSSKFQIIPLKSSPGGEIAFKDLLKIPQAKILQSCHGLLFCRSSFLVHPSEQFQGMRITIDHCSSVVTDDDRGYVYFICNPITGQFKRLSNYSSCPPLNKEMRFPYPRFSYWNDLIHAGFAFDPKLSFHYKIIFIFYSKSRQDCHSIFTSLTGIFIYSSETDSWTWQSRDVTELFTGALLNSIIGQNKSVFCNGVIHWVIPRPTLPSHMLLYFDVDTMIFKKMSLLKSDHLKLWNSQEYEGHLCIVANEDQNPSQCHVLQVAADYSGWFVKYSFNLQSLKDAYPSKGIDLQCIFSIVLAKNVEELMLVIVVNGWAIGFNPLGGTSKRICEVKLTQRYGGGDRSLSFNYTTHQFFESLFWL